MVKVYAIALAIGVIGLVVVILGGALADNLNRERSDPGRRLGPRGQCLIGALVGFGMAGISAEFSTFDPDWPVGLLVAAVGAAAGWAWTSYSLRKGAGTDVGPV